MANLGLVVAFAATMHAPQTDKSGHPYILHPLRVMLNVEDEARAVALCHDLIEDTAVVPTDLRVVGLSEEEIEAVLLVTRWPEGHPDRVTYRQFIAQIAKAPGQAGVLARQVKVADINDNLGRITPELKGMEKRYQMALDILGSRL